MIVISLALILIAVVLLVFGLAGGSSLLLVVSIGASLLAAVALVAGARQAAGGPRFPTAPRLARRVARATAGSRAFRPNRPRQTWTPAMPGGGNHPARR